MKKRKIISAVLLIILLVCLFLLIGRAVRQKNANSAYDAMREDAVHTVSETADDTEVINAGEDEPAAQYEGVPEVDFDALSETNTDICAWITVPGTQVDYPVLRNEASDDPYDDYYLMHTAEKTSGLPGAIYMEPCNAGDFSDANTVLYGHNMKNGSMFGSLHEFENDTFFEEHEYVYVVTPEKLLVYRIFAEVTYSNLHIMGNYDFDDTDDYEAFLQSLEENRDLGDLFREGTEVTADDRILTLSTCVKGEDEKRLLVVAVLTDEVPENE